MRPAPIPTAPLVGSVLLLAVLALSGLALSGLALSGCSTTEALYDDLGPDMSEIRSTEREPVEPGIEGVDVWPAPGRLYDGLRKAPTAVLVTAYDAPMAAYAEIAHLLAWTWGGQDVVSESMYATWKELEPVNDGINPLPRWPEPAPRPRTGTYTGWTVGDNPARSGGPAQPR